VRGRVQEWRDSSAGGNLRVYGQEIRSWTGFLEGLPR